MGLAWLLYGVPAVREAGGAGFVVGGVLFAVFGGLAAVAHCGGGGTGGGGLGGVAGEEAGSGTGGGTLGGIGGEAGGWDVGVEAGALAGEVGAGALVGLLLGGGLVFQRGDGFGVGGGGDEEE